MLYDKEEYTVVYSFLFRRNKRMKKFSMTGFVIWLFIIALLVFYINDAMVMHKIEKNKESIDNVQVETNAITEENKEKIKNTETVEKNNKDIEIYYFYVGQADCILVKTEEANMLIDAGNNDDGKLICDYLKKLKIGTIDYLIGTHAHEDHIGGLDNVIKSFNIGTIYMPSKETTTKTFEDVIKATKAKKINIKTPKIGEKFLLADAECEIVYVDNEAEDLNESSIVIMMKHGEKKYLFTADIGNTSEELVKWEDIDVLKVAHHGSRKSSSEKFLKQTKPDIAIISLGKENEYGYPHDEAIRRLNNVNAKIYRTDKDGTILLKSDGNKIEIEKIQVSLDGIY